MTVKFLGRLVAILMVLVLTGAPAVQAAIAPSCHTVSAGASDDRQLFGQTLVATPMPDHGTPCDGMMPGCPDMLDCSANAGLPVQAVGESHKLIWTSDVYRAGIDMHEGLTVKPDLDPPITI